MTEYGYPEDVNNFKIVGWGSTPPNIESVVQVVGCAVHTDLKNGVHSTPYYSHFNFSKEREKNYLPL